MTPVNNNSQIRNTPEINGSISPGKKLSNDVFKENQEKQRTEVPQIKPDLKSKEIKPLPTPRAQMPLPTKSPRPWMPLPASQSVAVSGTRKKNPHPVGNPNYDREVNFIKFDKARVNDEIIARPLDEPIDFPNPVVNRLLQQQNPSFNQRQSNIQTPMRQRGQQPS